MECCEHISYRRNKSNNKLITAQIFCRDWLSTQQRGGWWMLKQALLQQERNRSSRESVQYFSPVAFIHKVWEGLSGKIDSLGITSHLDLALALSGHRVGFARAQVSACRLWACNKMVKYLGSNPDPSVQKLFDVGKWCISLVLFFLFCGMEWWQGS